MHLCQSWLCPVAHFSQRNRPRTPNRGRSHECVWLYRYPKAGLRFWKLWSGRAFRGRIESFRKLAPRRKGYLAGIIGHCRWPPHAGLLEGINNPIKVVKRMAYGFRDDECFLFKIRAAFPGDAG